MLVEKWLGLCVDQTSKSMPQFPLSVSNATVFNPRFSSHFDVDWGPEYDLADTWEHMGFPTNTPHPFSCHVSC
jgi:hypothetical protein